MALKNKSKSISKVRTLLWALSRRQLHFKDFQKGTTPPLNTAILEAEPYHPKKSGTRIALVAHVYYEEFIPSLAETIRACPLGTEIFVTTTSTDNAIQIRKILDGNNSKYQIAITPNVGRNFAPWLVEFGKELLNFDSLIHVHSKKSLHANHSLVEEWNKRNERLFASKRNVDRLLAVAENNEEIGIIYPFVADLFRKINFRWGVNREHLVKTIRPHDLTHLVGNDERIPFPIGGMFWARVPAIRELLAFNWSYDLFPEESGQVDDTLQHAIERIFGTTPLSKNFRHCMYVDAYDKFTTDVSFHVANN